MTSRTKGKRWLGRVLFFAMGLVSLGDVTKAAELEIGKTYQGGTLIESAVYGLQFTVPNGWTGLLPPGGSFFAMTPDNRSLIFATAEPGSAQDAQASLAQPLPLGNGINLQPIGSPRMEGSSFAIDYAVQGATEPYGSEGRAIVGEHGVVAGFIGVAPKNDVTRMLAELDKLVAEARLEPIAQK